MAIRMVSVGSLAMAVSYILLAVWLNKNFLK